MVISFNFMYVVLIYLSGKTLLYGFLDNCKCFLWIFVTNCNIVDIPFVWSRLFHWRFKCERLLAFELISLFYIFQRIQIILYHFLIKKKIQYKIIFYVTSFMRRSDRELHILFVLPCERFNDLVSVFGVFTFLQLLIIKVIYTKITSN